MRRNIQRLCGKGDDRYAAKQTTGMRQSIQQLRGKADDRYAATQTTAMRRGKRPPCRKVDGSLAANQAAAMRQSKRAGVREISGDGTDDCQLLCALRGAHVRAAVESAPGLREGGRERPCNLTLRAAAAAALRKSSRTRSDTLCEQNGAGIKWHIERVAFFFKFLLIPVVFFTCRDT